MTNETLQKASDCLIKRYFDNIPKIKCLFGDPGKSIEGLFNIQPNKDYHLSDIDPELYRELEAAPEYRNRRIEGEGIGFDYHKESSWTDPLRKPLMDIIINAKIQDNDRAIIATLMHELTHYWCWYCGYDYHDGNRQFEDKIRELNLPSNYDREFSEKMGFYITVYDNSKVEKYIQELKQAEVI